MVYKYSMMNPVNGKITSRFGKRRHPVTGVTCFHNGVDIACREGIPVVAPDFGTVTEIWDHERGGICLAMVSLTGVRYGFAHLSERSVRKDQTVVEGQLIALTGNTGITTGPHLHFTVQISGIWWDPLNYFDFNDEKK